MSANSFYDKNVKPFTTEIDLTQPFERRKRLAPIFASMHISTINLWSKHPVSHVRTFDTGVRVVFENGGTALLYNSIKTLCEAVDALELFCSTYKPCPVIKGFIMRYRGTKHIIETLEKTLCSHDTRDISEIRTVNPAIEVESAVSQEITDTFSRAPFQIVHDYLYACAFLAQTPDLLDRMNVLLGYRLGYAIADKKETGEMALKYLCQELNDFARSHPDGASNLHAAFEQGMFGDKKTDTIIVCSDYGKVEVQHEPHLNPVDWENRFRDMSRRYGR